MKSFYATISFIVCLFVLTNNSSAQITVSSTGLIGYSAGGCANNNGCTGCGVFNACSPCESRREVTCNGCGTYDCWEDVPSSVTIRYMQRWHKSLTCSNCNESSTSVTVDLNALKDNFTNTTYGEYNTVAPTTSAWTLTNPSGCGSNYNGTVSITGNDRGQNYNNHICNAGAFPTLNKGNTFTLPTSGKDNNEGDCTNGQQNEPNNPHKTVWYKFTTGAEVGPYIDAKLKNTNCNGFACVYTTFLAAFVGNPTSCSNLSGLSQIKSSTSVLSGASLRIDCPTPNTTYYLQVDRITVSDEFEFQIEISTPDMPSGKTNDLCTGAIDMGTLTAYGQTQGDAAGNNRWNNFCAGTAGDPNPGWTLVGVGTDPYQTVWFKFNSGVSHSIDINAYNDPHNWGDQIDLKLALYEGSTCPTNNTNLVAKNYTAGYSQSIEEICVKPNTDYYILVSGSNLEPLTGSTKEGFFGLSVKDRGPYPVNDLVCNAKEATIPPFFNYQNAYFSNETNVNGTFCWEPEPNWPAEALGKQNDHGVWYYLGQVPGRTIVADGRSKSNDNIGLQFALYSSTVAKGTCTTPNSTPALTLVQTEYNIISLDEVGYFNCLDPNKYYWMLVDGGDPSGVLASALEQGDFSLRFWFPTEGETNACNAQYLGAVPDNGSIYIENLANKCGANSIPGFPEPSNFGFDKAVIYTFTTPPAVGFTDASVKIEAFSNPYYPNQGITLEDVSVAGDAIDLQLAVYSDGPCNSGHYVESSYYDPTTGSGIDVSGLTGSDEAVIANCLKPNTTYYLVVDGGTNTDGYFDIKISDYNQHTTNDFLCQAIPISGTFTAPWTNCNSNATVELKNQNNYCATADNDIPQSLGIRPPQWKEMHGPVWYKFQAPKSGKLKIEAKNSVSDLLPPYEEPEISLQLAVFYLPGGYQGDCGNIQTEKDRLILVGSEYDAVFHDEDFTIECLMPDSTYYLMVDGTSELLCPTCDRGEFDLKLIADPRDRPAPNDRICDAINLGTPIPKRDTRVAPASDANANPSPNSGYPSATGLHNGIRKSSTPTCMRAENNFCAGVDGEPAITGGNFFSEFTPSATVWYKFTAPITMAAKISTFSDPDNLGDLLFTQIAVFESSDGTCNGTLIPLDASGLSNIFTGGGNTLTVECLRPGKPYYIMIDGAGLNPRGYFELEIEAVLPTKLPPPNDDICNAKPLTYPANINDVITRDNETNRCANIEIDVYPDPTTFSTDADVWYKFTTPNTPAPHAVKVEVTSGLPWPFGDAMDPQIALYKGSCPNSFELVEDQYSPLGLPFYESMEFHCLEQNTTYYLMVDGSGLNEEGNFNLKMTRINPHPLPTNDNICDVGSTFASGNLGTLGAATGSKIGDATNWHNFCADVEPNENSLMTDNAYSLDQTVWFHFKTPNVSNNIDVEIRALNDPNSVGDQIDLEMLLAQGTPTCGSGNPFSSLTPIEAVSPIITEDILGDPLAFNATMKVCLPPNKDFYIQVDGSGLNTQGYFTIEVENKGTTSAPVNDNICNAKTLPSDGVMTGSYKGYENDDNNCATLEDFEKQYSAGGIQRSVWYKFVAPTSADVTVEVKGNSWIPFSKDYFLPDVTIWELADETYASIDNNISGCPTPNATQWNQLEYNDAQFIPNTLANGVYPTVNLTPLCLKPGYTYYVQVDGVAGIGLDGYFDIKIKDNQPSFNGPPNDEAAGAIIVPFSSTSCQYSNGTWQGGSSGYSFGDNSTWSNPNLVGILTSAGIPTCNENCGDVWFKFQMPAACRDNTQTFIKIEGDDEFNLDLNGYPELVVAAYNAGSSGLSSNLTYMKCSRGGFNNDVDFSISANPGDWIYLQVWDESGDEKDKHFKLCVSEQKSADDCIDATNMELDVPYCWSIESNIGESPNPAIIGSGLNTCFSDGVPKHSSYFKFTTDDMNNFCDDYYVYINTDAMAKELPNGANHACISGTGSSVSINYTLYELLPGGNECTPGAANVSQRNCITWTDCGSGSAPSNLVGPHGNGGIINDTLWYNRDEPTFALKANTTYFIVLDYKIDNIIYESRVILDGIIEVGRRCKGRVWEYTTDPVVTTDKYCTTRDGWRHYYDDKGTPETEDDKYIFSVYPNGNNFEGEATVTLDPTYHIYEDVPGCYAQYVMERRWDYTITSGSIDSIGKPVKIRFYYQTDEKQAIIDAAHGFIATHSCGYYEPFEWFKSRNGHIFNPYSPNDVDAYSIKVGPNGFSQTGCESYFDQYGVEHQYLLKRCNTISAIDWEEDHTYQSCNGIHYVEYTPLPGFSGGTGGTGVNPDYFELSPLPIELLSFTGYNDEFRNILNWVTASEKDAWRFEIEKSSDAYIFEKIGEVPASGNSNESKTYQFIDRNPYNGDNYYRLKMIDFDGSFEYSKIINIPVGNAVMNIKDFINVYPNPTNSMLNVEMYVDQTASYNIRIVNTLGQEIYSEFKSLKLGLNKFVLNTSAYAQGTYILSISNQTSSEQRQVKFVKQ